MIPRAVVVTLVIVLAAGCGGKFSCPAPNEGIKCQPVSEVYRKAIDGEIRKSPVEMPTGKKEAPATQAFPAKPENVSSGVVKHLETDKSIPLRIPPKIIRIWFAPWEDADGDLHQGGYLYSEISDPRGRWIIGEKAPEDTGLMRFLSRKPPSPEKETFGVKKGGAIFPRGEAPKRPVLLPAEVRKKGEVIPHNQGAGAPE